MFTANRLRKIVYRALMLILSLALLLQSSPVMAGPDPDNLRSQLARLQVEAVSSPAQSARQNHVLPPQAVVPSSSQVVLARATREANSALVTHPLASQLAPQPFKNQLISQAWATPIAPNNNRPLHFDEVPVAIVPPGQEHLLLRKGVSLRPPGLASIQPASTLSLTTGWNLISIPEELSSTDPATVLASIAGSYKWVYAYDGCDPVDPWKLYDPNAPAASDLTAITPAMGLWIEMTAPAVLDMAGTSVTNLSIPLCTGWNLIGYPLQTALPVAGALSSIAGKYTRVFGYDVATVSDPWAIFDTVVPTWANDLQTMQTGRGYWVLATENATLVMGDTLPAPPVADLTGLEDLDEITTLTPITGTIDSASLANWALEYRQIGDDTWIAFASGTTSVINDRLGVFDPTLLLNGIYEIRLTVNDLFGQSTTEVVQVLVTGEQKIGLFTLSFIDLNIPVSGIPITLIRTYDSRNKQIGDFGVGWTLSTLRGSYTNNRKPGDGWTITASDDLFFPIPCAKVIETKKHITEIRLSDTEVYRFALDVQSFGIESVFSGGCKGTADFVQVRGNPGASLVSLNGSNEIFYGGTDQVEFDLDSENVGQTYEPEDVRLTTFDGRQFDLNLNAGLRRIRDTNGNILSITDTGVVHSTGKSVEITRDAENRITRISSLAGNITYTYDANGDLVTFINQEQQNTKFSYDNKHNLIDITDPRGIHAVRTEYDVNGRLVATIDAAGNRIEFDHDIGNNLDIIRDRLGNQTIYEYDRRGNVVAKTNAVGDKTLYTYDVDDNQTSITDPLGNTTQDTYDSHGNRLTETDPSGNVRRWTYDPSGHVTSMTNATGATTNYTYDNKGNLISTEGPEGDVESMTYTSAGVIASYTDAAGTLYTATHDTAGNILSDQHTLMTLDGPVVSKWQYGYTNNGNLTSLQGPDGSQVTANYNALGALTQSSDPLGNLTTLTWDEAGQMQTLQLPDANTVNVEYDALGRQTAVNLSCCGRTEQQLDAEGRVVRVILPDGNYAQNSWNSVGQRISTTDPLGNTTHFAYDLAERLTSVERPDGATAVYERDPVGRITKIIDAEGNQTVFTYDGEGRITNTLFADGRSSSTTYDGNGQVRTQTMLSGSQWTYNYGVMGRLVNVVDPLGNTTTYGHNSDGVFDQFTDGNSNTTEMQFDTLGRMIRRTLPEGQVEHLVYDEAGQVTSYSNFAGQTTNFTYTDGGRPLTTIFPDGRTEQRSYDAFDRLQTIEDGRGQTTFAYNSIGLLSEWTGPEGITVGYDYDAARQVTAVTTNLGETNLQYTSSGMVEAITDPAGDITQYTRNRLGLPVAVTLPNGNLVKTSYDSIGRTTAVTYTTSTGQVLYALAYSHDSAGRVAEIAESTGRQVEYTYDDLDQLVEERIVEIDTSVETITYAYDSTGNLLSRIDSFGTKLFSYDQNNRLLNDGSFLYAWNANGEMVSRTGAEGNEQYEYDPLGRLTRFERTGSNSILIEYEYDFDGLLSTRTANSIRTHFVWDRSATFPQLLEQRADNGDLLLRYTNGDIFPAYVRSAAGDLSYFITDPLGTVRAIASGNGAVTETPSYDAFGRPRSGSSLGNTGYAGAFTDPDSGLVFMRSRWYSPAMARFVQPDADPGDPTDPRTLNRYVYSFNDPVNRFDPTGQYSMAEINITLNIASSLANITLSHFPSAATAVAKALLGGVFGGLPFGSFDAVLGGANVSADLRGSNKASASAGVDVLSFRKDGTTAFYWYAGVGFGDTESINGYVGRVFNTPEPVDYQGGFISLTLSPMVAKSALPKVYPELPVGPFTSQTSITIFRGFNPIPERTSHGFSVSKAWGLPVVGGGYAQKWKLSVAIAISWYCEAFEISPEGQFSQVWGCMGRDRNDT